MSKVNNLNAARQLATKTEDAYMAGHYGWVSWMACCKLLLDRGYTEQESEAILRSRHMQWAADSRGNGKTTNCAVFKRYLDSQDVRWQLHETD